MTSSFELPADRPIRVGIVGLSASRGWAIDAHVPALIAMDGYELRALSASSKERALAAAQAHDVPLAFGSAEELAASDEVDLVVVTVRVPEHAELVGAALDAGKAVLCEWPLAKSLGEARDLAATARDKGVFTAVGLQARAAPTVRYVADLVADGYVGKVLSTSIVGSGASWGPVVTPPERHRLYLLDAANGATMLSIVVGHAIDGVASVLGEPSGLRSTLATRWPEVLDEAGGETVAQTAADQIAFTGTFPGGAVLSAHYRAGRSRATNLRWEINGSEGDLVIEVPPGAPIGHLQLGALTLTGARGDEDRLSPLEVPASYHRVPALAGAPTSIGYAVAHAYAQLLEDVTNGSRVVPDFEHAVRRHETLQAILDDAGEPWRSNGA